MHQPFYERTDTQNRSIKDQFYNYELVKVTVSHQTEFEIDKMVRSCYKEVLNNILSSREDTTGHLTLGKALKISRKYNGSF